MRRSGEETASVDGEVVARAGRPKLGGPTRVRITTTVEPSKLARLRAHALSRRKSLGQLADEYVDKHFPSTCGHPE